MCYEMHFMDTYAVAIFIYCDKSRIGNALDLSNNAIGQEYDKLSKIEFFNIGYMRLTGNNDINVILIILY